MSADWRDYENYILRHFQRLFPDAAISRDVRRTGVISKTKRQIDILIEGCVAGFDVDIVVECKYFNRNIDVSIIDSFVGFLNDVRCSKGVLITNEGSSKAARNRAEFDTRDVEIRIIDFENLEQFQSFMCIPYAGGHGALVSAPEGWVADLERPREFNAFLHPLGVTGQEAMAHEGFIYLNFHKKNRESSTLDELRILQDSRIANRFPQARFDYCKTVERADAPTLLRVADVHEGYRGREFTIFVDYPDYIMFFVLMAPAAKEERYLRKLEWVVEKFIPLAVVFDPSGNPVRGGSVARGDS